jgi:2Fe-2S ferredoxin
MPKVTFVHQTGAREEFEVPTGTTMMHAAVLHDVDGIVGECGGSAMCATCHVYVDDAFLDRLPPRSAVEEALLDATASPRKRASRLSCQITVTPDIDGLIVYLPDQQV